MLELNPLGVHYHFYKVPQYGHFQFWSIDKVCNVYNLGLLVNNL